METKIFKNTAGGAAEIIKRGGLVAVPTETVYGLAANALDQAAVSGIYEVKGRPAIKPLSLMVPDPAAMDEYCIGVPAQARTLAAKYWPGPLTIVMKAKPGIPSIVLAGGSTVGLRCPDHQLTLELLRSCHVPLAAPSANPSGAESARDASKVLEYFDGKIDAVIDGGHCGLGRESTIIDMCAAPYRILRQGALPADDIADTLADTLKIVGITGGTGCGKTTALNELQEMGALILDCDAIYHELLENSRELIAEIDKFFPGAVQDGVLDRKALGALVFTDEEALRDLNIITHKYVHIEVRRRLREFAMAGGAIAAIDAIELFSSGLNKRCFKTLAVLSDREHRVQRIMSRDNITREYALMRINAQRPPEYYESRCDFTLYNNADREQFRNDCRQLFKEMFNNG